MLQALNISSEDIIQEIKLSCQFPQIIAAINTRKIIHLKATQVNIQVKSEELQQAADEFRFIHKLSTAEQTWMWLDKYNLSLNEFKELIYSNVIANKLAQYLFADQVEPYFIKNKLNYLQLVMYEVVLDDEDLAFELFHAIQAGKNCFAEVAYQYIEDKNLRRCGGYRGILHYGELLPEIAAVVIAANPPQLLKPILTATGVHLIMVEELIEPKLDEILGSKILADLFYRWLNQELEQTDIKITIAS